MGPRGLLLDLDDTAYAYGPSHAAGLAAAAAAAREAGWPNGDAFAAAYAAAREEVKGRLAGRAASHCRLLYFKAMVERDRGRSDLALALELHDRYWAAFSAAMAPEAGCAEALARLRARGVRLAWLSNFTTERQIRKLATLGLLAGCDYLVTSEEAGADKPDPAAYRLALARLGLAPGEAWMFGDSLADDVEGARAVGLEAVWLRRPGAAGEAPGARAVVGSWAELVAAVEAADG